MAKQKGGLGRGLDSLLGSVPSETASTPVKEEPAAVEHSKPVRIEDGAEKKLPVKQSAMDDGDAIDKNEPYSINEDNLTIKSVTQRDVSSEPKAPRKESQKEQPKVNQEVSAESQVKATDELEVALIGPNPQQPRMNFKKEELEELSESIKKNGLLQPIVVRKVDDKYQIIAGERRWQASKQAGLEKVPVRIIEADDDEAIVLALIENIQRSDLNPIEEAYGYRRMMERGKMTQTQVAQAVSKGRSTIANALRLLELPEDAQEMLFEDVITAGHARAILSIPDKEGRAKLTHKLKEEKLSVRETEAIARLLAGKKEKKPAEKSQTPKSYKTVARSLRDALQTDVRIRSTQGKNKIEISFKDEADLERLYRLLLNE